MKELLFACSGPGASTAIAANTEYAWQHALLDAGLVLVSIGLWNACRRYSVFPLLALAVILTHPAWTVSALSGYCGLSKASMALGWTIVLVVGLSLQLLCWIVIRSRPTHRATLENEQHR